MAVHDQGFVQRRTSVRRRLTGMLDTPFDRRARKLAKDVALLRALSDAQLSRLGIPRSEILMHVFGKAGR